MRGLPNSSVAADVMGNTVNFYNQTVKESPDFAQAAVALSRILTRFPDAKLSDFTWATTTDPNKPIAGSATSGLDSAQTAGQNSGAVSAPIDGRIYQILIVEAKFDDVGQDQRKALERVASLKGAIAKDMGAMVSVLVQPLDASENVSLRGSARPIPEKHDAEFAFRIVIPPRS